jgi:hypothetical protein
MSPFCVPVMREMNDGNAVNFATLMRMSDTHRGNSQ